MNSNRPTSVEPSPTTIQAQPLLQTSSSTYNHMSSVTYQQLLQTKSRIEEELFQT